MKISQHKKGFLQIVNWIDKRYKDKTISLIVVVEATGVYHEKVSHYLHKSDYCVSVVLPNLSNNYIKSLGIKSKTDSIDSKALAQMGIERKLHIWIPPNAQLTELRSLTRHKNNLQKVKINLFFMTVPRASARASRPDFPVYLRIMLNFETFISA